MNATLTLLICGECGTGNYGVAVSTDYTCGHCGHGANVCDFVLDEGESLTTDAHGLLYVVTEG